MDFSQGPYSGVGTPSGGVHFPDHLSFTSAWPLVSAQPASAPLLGVDGQFDPVAVDLESESPHILISSGTGGGKSTLIRSITSQTMVRGARAVFLDAKRHSHRWAKGLEPVAQYAQTIPDIGNALVSLGKEVHRRNAIVEAFAGEVEDAPVGPPIFVAFEEMNATMAALREMDRKLPKGEYKAMDGYRDVMFMGRAAKIHVIAVAQFADARSMGGSDIRENFATRILIRYTKQAWTMLAWDAGLPQSAPREPGRGMVVQGGRARTTQFMEIKEAEARRFVLHSPYARNLARALTPSWSRLPEAWRQSEGIEL